MEDDGPELLQEAAWQVYAVPPAEFVATRTAWVRRLRGEGHRETAKAVNALRKPSVSAAAVNALARSEDPVRQRLRDVGAHLRHAQSALDGASLAALRGERDALLTEWVVAARRHAPGDSLTAAVEAEVRDTAVAALADAEATEVVLSGTLTRALSYSGFGEVDVADAVARTSTGVVLTRLEGGRGGEPKADADDAPEEPAADEAEEGATDEPAADEEDEAENNEEDEPAEDEAEEDEAEADEAEADEAEADEAEADEAEDPEDEDELTDLRDELEQAEAEVSAARDRRRAAAAADRTAGSQVTRAERAVDEARQVLTRAEQELEEASAARATTADELSEAETALSTARERRDAAREALEEAEDAG